MSATEMMRQALKATNESVARGETVWWAYEAGKKFILPLQHLEHDYPKLCDVLVMLAQLEIDERDQGCDEVAP